MIKKLFNVAWDMWEHRNGIAHAMDHPWRQEENRQIENEIRNQFKMGTATLQGKDKFRLESLATVLNFDYDKRIQWLGSMKAARSAFVEAQTMQTEGPNQLVTDMREGLISWLRGNHSGGSLGTH